jgi:hypothetical protein
MTIAQVEPKKFPSGNGMAIATIAPRPVDLTARLGIQFQLDEDDLGPYDYAVIRLPASGLIWLIRYHHPQEMDIAIIADDEADSQECLLEIERELNLCRDEFTWRRDLTPLEIPPERTTRAIYSVAR